MGPRTLPKAIGRYEIARQLGVGAMGRVFLARDPVLERHVAIKILREDLSLSEDDREALLVRMRHEARAAARVTHPNLCVIHDMGEDPSLGLYLVFEYIEGPTLKQRLKEGRLPGRSVARIAKELGGALTFAHERGVLHRDVKPDNIILSPTGTKLTDFGIARLPDSTLTHAGGLMGTPAYSAPETFQKSAFSPESDQFALGATLYEALRGARAFPGDDALSVASQITTGEPEPFAVSLGYQAALDEILGRAMAKPIEERFDSCKTLGNLVMDSLLSDQRSGVERSVEVSTVGRAVQEPRARSPWPVAIAAMLVLVAFGGLYRLLLRGDPPATQTDERATAVETELPDEAISAKKPAPRKVESRPKRPATVAASAPLTSSPLPSSSVPPRPSASSAPSIGPSEGDTSDEP